MGQPESKKQIAVTGGSRGIGREIVRTLAAAGYNVRFTFHNSESEARSLVAELQSNWPRQEFSIHGVDFGDKGGVGAFADELSETDGLYGLVHNAGQSCDALAAMLDQDRAETAMQVNFWALTRLVKGAIRQMVPARAGRIVGMGSIAALHGMSGNSAYAATKGAMLSYVRTAVVELARKGVTVNFVAPGYVDTELMEPYAAFRRALEKQIPVGRFAQPGEIAALVNHLMAPEAAYITGSVLAVDGGLSAGIALGA